MATILVPERTVEKTVDQITFNINTKQVVIRVRTLVDGKYSEDKVTLDILDFLQDKGYSAAQITGIKTLFKQLMAEAFGILEADMTDEVFPEE